MEKSKIKDNFQGLLNQIIQGLENKEVEHYAFHVDDTEITD